MKIDWNAIKKEYLSKDTVTLKDVAEKYGVPHQTVRRKAMTEKWSQTKKERATRFQQKIEKAMAGVEDAQAEKTADQLTKINRIAEKLLDNLESGAEAYNRPTQVLNMSAALEKLLDIIRNANSLPTLEEERKYELAKEKLDFEKQKARMGDGDDNENGVVILPEVKADE